MADDVFFSAWGAECESIGCSELEVVASVCLLVATG